MNLKGRLSRPVRSRDLVLAGCFLALLGLAAIYGPPQYKEWQKRRQRELWWEAQRKESTNQCIDLVFGLRMEAGEAAAELLAGKDQVNQEPPKPEDELDLSVTKTRLTLTFRQWCSFNENSLSLLLSVVKGQFDACASRGTFDADTVRSFAKIESRVQGLVALLSSCAKGEATKGDVEAFGLDELDRSFALLVQQINSRYPQRKKGEIELRFEARSKESRETGE